MLINSLETEVKNINKFILFVLSDALILKNNALIVEFTTEYINSIQLNNQVIQANLYNMLTK